MGAKERNIQGMDSMDTSIFLNLRANLSVPLIGYTIAVEVWNAAANGSLGVYQTMYL